MRCALPRAAARLPYLTPAPLTREASPCTGRTKDGSAALRYPPVRPPARPACSTACPYRDAYRPKTPAFRVLFCSACNLIICEGEVMTRTGPRRCTPAASPVRRMVLRDIFRFGSTVWNDRERQPMLHAHSSAETGVVFLFVRSNCFICRWARAGIQSAAEDTTRLVPALLEALLQA